jgi:hypothetical protein
MFVRSTARSRKAANSSPRNADRLEMGQGDVSRSDTGGTNPLEGAWNTPFGKPPFDLIAPEHFGPAFDRAQARRRAEIDAIAANAVAPDFNNSMAALERGGHDLTCLAYIFFVLASANTSDALQEIERDVSIAADAFGAFEEADDCSTITFMRPPICAIQLRPIGPSAAGCRQLRRCCNRGLDQEALGPAELC